MPDLHVEPSPRAVHIAVEGTEILPSPGPRNADLCHPGSSRGAFNLILFHPGGNAPVLTSVLPGRLSQSDFLPTAQGFLQLRDCPVGCVPRWGQQESGLVQHNPVSTKYVEMAILVWSKRR